MIDFKNSSFVKLRQVSNDNFSALITQLLTNDELIISSFQGIRDGVIFTDKRIISINIHGVTGKKKNFTSLPYSKIQAFSVETAGILDIDSELQLNFTGLGTITFQFESSTDVSAICRIISEYVL